MRTLHTKFLLAAALLTTSTALHAARFWPTSPLIQIGDDTDIFFDGSASMSLNDNLFSSENKVSGTSLTLSPGLTLEYAKDSPLFVTASFKRSQVSYYGSGNLSRLNNSQDSIGASVFIDQGGPLKLTLSSNYNEAARNDNLTQQGIDGKTIGETLVRQGNYTHSITADYRLTEKINANLTIANNYNRYLNPTKIRVYDLPPDNPSDYHDTYNTNSLSEINTKSVTLNVTYQAPGDNITYGFKYSHDQNDFSPAAYFDYYTKTSTTNTVRPTAGTTDIVKSAKDFYGLTSSGKLTRSGKLSLTGSLGFSSSSTSQYDGGGSKLSGLSYNINLKHQLTDWVSHGIDLARSTAPTPNGTDSDTKTYGYTVIYSATDSLSLNFHVSKSDVAVGTTTVATMDYNLAAVYNYNRYLNFSATLDSLKTDIGSSSYLSNSFVIQASFRY